VLFSQFADQAPTPDQLPEILPALSPKQLADAIWSFAKQGLTPTAEVMDAVAAEVLTKLSLFRCVAMLASQGGMQHVVAAVSSLHANNYSAMDCWHPAQVTRPLQHNLGLGSAQVSAKQRVVGGI
jgi:hypothetical protein